MGQPMETAPTDREILLTGAVGSRGALQEVFAMWSIDGWKWTSGEGFVRDPTSWRDIPEAS